MTASSSPGNDDYDSNDGNAGGAKVYDGTRMEAPVRHVAFDPHSGTSMKGKGAGGSSSERFPYFLAIASESGNSPVAIADVMDEYTAGDAARVRFGGSERRRASGRGGAQRRLLPPPRSERRRRRRRRDRAPCVYGDGRTHRRLGRVVVRCPIDRARLGRDKGDDEEDGRDGRVYLWDVDVAGGTGDAVEVKLNRGYSNHRTGDGSHGMCRCPPITNVVWCWGEDGQNRPRRANDRSSRQ